MPSCAVYGCPSNSRNAKHLQFFCFPKNKLLSEKWMQLCRRADQPNVNYARMCMLHFVDENFKRNLQAELLGIPEKRKILRSDAIPSRNLPKVINASNKQSSGTLEEKSQKARNIKNDSKILKNTAAGSSQIQKTNAGAVACSESETQFLLPEVGIS